MSSYTPPFSITPKMLALTAGISERLGELKLYHDLEAKPHLRRSSRIRSIQSSLAIEANSLSLKEVRDIINGHEVVGPEREILEVKNAYAAYEELPEIDPYSVKDLKRIHGIMEKGLIPDSGRFRDHDEGVFSGDKVIFFFFSPTRVPTLIKELFFWMKKAGKELNPLILSSVFHYEFVFSHPFSHGNGRMARLWQTAILSKWRSVFRYLPVESYIEKDLAGYYNAIAECHKTGRSDVFVEFMLERIERAVEERLKNASSKDGGVTEYVSRLLDTMDYDEPYTAGQLLEKLGLKSKEALRRSYLHPAMELGLIEMEFPDKPRSRNQRYIKR